jgi:hypothetical protein
MHGVRGMDRSTSHPTPIQTVTPPYLAGKQGSISRRSGHVSINLHANDDVAEYPHMQEADAPDGIAPEYETPTLAEVGDVAVLTNGTNSNDTADRKSYYY